MIKVLCMFPGCNEWAIKGHRYCEKHYKESQEKHKAFQNAKRANEGMYNTYRWKKLRVLVISAHPYCSCCGCKSSPDNPLTVDHIIAPRGNEELFYDESNLQVLCRNCHNQKTAREVQERNQMRLFY